MYLSSPGSESVEPDSMFLRFSNKKRPRVRDGGAWRAVDLFNVESVGQMKS